MKEYPFEYTKQGTAYLLFLLSFGLIGLGAIILSNLFKKFLVVDIIASIVLGFVFFLFNKYRIKKTGKAELSENVVILQLSEVTHIAFSELKYYYIYDGKNGIVFTLGFLNGSKVKIGANNNFCDNEPLKIFLTDLQAAIDKYNIQNQANVIHLQSILARKNSVYVLIFITILIILGFVFTKMPVMSISIGFTLPIMINWIQYFQLKRNNKIVNF
ncbi:MAG: hypothetical protein ACTHJ8_11980 [Mucilaginibacter sp.]